MKKVLIIGKRGFIGKSLNKFLKLKHNVKLISFKEALSLKSTPRIGGNVEVKHISIFIRFV